MLGWDISLPFRYSPLMYCHQLNKITQNQQYSTIFRKIVAYAVNGYVDVVDLKFVDFLAV